MKENKFQKQVIKQLENQCAFIINLHGHMMQRAGLPDLQIIHKNWKGFLELKCEDYEASALQRAVAAKIELRGTPIYVLRCVEKSSGALFTYSEDTKYQLENFSGEVITPFGSLKSLLRILIGLDKPKLHCEYLRDVELPTGDTETCINQCVDYTRDKCREKWNLEN